MPEELSELFDRQYRENCLKVYRLALALTGNTPDAEDITQEAFSRAFRSYHTFREESSFFTWIYRITINVANDYMKYKTKFPVYNLTEDLGYSLEEIIDPNPANNPETELLSNQAKVKCLHSLTECLQAKERKVFCLSITLGLPQKHVAAILDCSVGSVKTTLHRAKQRWFGYMEDRCQLIRKSNPCNCKQWVRFGLSQGWITNQTPAVSSPSITSQARKEISDLRRLRDIYHELYQARAEETFANRIMDGMNKREWAFLG